MTPLPIDLSAAIARYRAGETLQGIATDLGMGVSTLARRFHLAGVPRRKPGKEPLPLDAIALATAYQSGWTIPALARQHGVSVGAIRSRLDGRGVRRRSRGHPGWASAA